MVTNKASKNRWSFFKVSYVMRLPIVQLLHSVQARPDCSDKVGPVSPSKLNDAQTGLTSAKNNNNSWQIKLRNWNTSSKLRKTVSILEVILQSTFSQTLTSFSKQKRVNAHGYNSATRYFDDETSVSFYS